MTTTIVQKYGGSSVASVEKIGRVADCVVATRNAGHAVVVVVSAMGKTTDELIALARSVDPDPPRRELDMLVSTGERVAMALLSMAIQKRGASAISFTGSQSGIITTNHHFDARIVEVRPARIEEELAKGRVVIVAGYQGMSVDREITTLGRGGTDTTAVAIAAALRAERAEIYSDVDGVYSADPRIVAEAKHLPSISFEEMQELAHAGAKVLNATAVEFARANGIAIHARAIHVPSARETVVRSMAPPTRAVTSARDVVRARAADAAGVLGLLEEHRVQVLDVTLDARGASVTATTTTCPSADAFRTKLGTLATVELGLGVVTLIGRGLGDSPTNAHAVRERLAVAGIDAKSVSLAPMRISAVVDAARLDDAVRIVHEAFA